MRRGRRMRIGGMGCLGECAVFLLDVSFIYLLHLELTSQRNSSLLTLYPPSIPPSTNDDLAHTYGTKIRQALLSSSSSSCTTPQFNAYVNYAYGDESTEAIYGYEEWRLEKLRRLKKEWDPRGVFRWFHPIR